MIQVGKDKKLDNALLTRDEARDFIRNFLIHEVDRHALEVFKCKRKAKLAKQDVVRVAYLTALERHKDDITGTLDVIEYLCERNNLSRQETGITPWRASRWFRAVIA